EGYAGELRIIGRSTRKERVLAREVEVEDAHRAACQQWAAGGSRVVYHTHRNRRWWVMTIDPSCGREIVLAADRQVGFGAALGEWVPIHGCHWAPGVHRDLEVVNVLSGEIRTVL